MIDYDDLSGQPRDVVLKCMTCGSVVVDPDLHSAWHEKENQ